MTILKNSAPVEKLAERKRAASRRAAVERLESRTLMTSVVVNTTVDALYPAGSGLVSLRNAVAIADNSTSPTTITFDPTVFVSAQTIVENGTSLVLSNTNEPTTISGTFAGVTLDANNASTGVVIDSGVKANLSNLAIIKGSTSNVGGGIDNQGTLDLSDATILDNTADFGGGISNKGIATLTNVTLAGNHAIEGNGGGSGTAGGIYNYGTLNIYDSTIVGNTAVASGGGIATGSGAATIVNTIIAGNTCGSGQSGPDVSGTFTSLGFNVVGKTNGSSGWNASDLTGTIAAPLNPELGALAHNGGPTQTLLPLSGSPAISHGSVSFIPAGITTDQRGLYRTVNGTVDIGAVEQEATTAPPDVLAFVAQPSDGATGNIGTITVNVDEASGALITTDDSDITLAVAGGPGGTLGGTTTIAAVNGVATFGNLTLSEAGAYTLIATDGSLTSATSSPFSLTANTDPSSVTLTAMPGSIALGNAVTLTATVQGSAGTTPTGTVTFSLNGTPVGTEALQGNGTAALTTSSLPTGSDETTASYSGDGIYSASVSAAVTVDVTPPSSLPIASITSLTSASANPAPVGTAVTFGGNVASSTGGGPTPTGTVTFYDGGTALGATGVQSNGSFTFSTSSLPAGTDVVTASYSGDENYSASASSPATETVTASTGVPAFGNLVLPPSLIAGEKFASRLPVSIANQGNALAGVFTFNLYADTSAGLNGNQTLLATLARNLSLKTGGDKAFSFNVHSLPASLPDGTYYLVVEVIDPTGATNLAASARTVQVAAPFVSLAASAGIVTPANLIPGKSGSIIVTVTNDGNETATGPLDLALSPSADGATPLADVTLASSARMARIKPGQTVRVKLHFRLTSTLNAGSYYPYLSISLAGNSTTTVGPTPFTVE